MRDLEEDLEEDTHERISCLSPDVEVNVLK